MSISKLALAIPLSLGIACSTTGANSERTGAMWPFGVMSDGSLDSDRPARGTGAQVSPPGGVPTGQDGLSIQPASGTEYAAGSSGTSGPSDSSTGSSGSGTGSSDSSSGASGSMSGSSGSGSQGSSDSPGAAASSDTGPRGADSGSAAGSSAGSGGSSDTMGSGSPSGSSGQGTMGSSDHGHPGGMAGAGQTGAHAGAQQVMGKISKISREEISIKPRSGEAMTLKLRPETMVSINGKDSKPTQLKQGQTVRASYESVDGDDVAVKIEVGKARQAKSGKARSGHMKGGGSGAGADHAGHGHGGSMGGGSMGGSEGGATGGSR